jgi:ATPase MipZ
MQIADNEHAELTQFMDVVSAVERSFDLIVIDTPEPTAF